MAHWEVWLLDIQTVITVQHWLIILHSTGREGWGGKPPPELGVPEASYSKGPDQYLPLVSESGQTQPHQVFSIGLAATTQSNFKALSLYGFQLI